MRLQKPAMASSTELSTTSQMRWCSPFSPVEPMYMPGRLRTGSSPDRTDIWLALYAVAEGSSAMRDGAPFQSWWEVEGWPEA